LGVVNPKTRRILWVLAPVLLAAGLWPFERTTSLPVNMQVVDETGRPTPGILVKQQWRDWSAESVEHKETTTTDANGRVVFPERKVKTCRLCIAAIATSQVLRSGVHAGIGPFVTISAHGSDPHFWGFENYNEKPPPEKMILKKSDTPIWP
jgi:hypothetical protein